MGYLKFLDNIISDIYCYSEKDDLNYNLKFLTKQILNYLKNVDYLNYNYILNVLNDETNNIAFYYNNNCEDFLFNKNNWLSIMTYYLDLSNDQPICYILLLYTPKQHRNKGIGSKFINSFCDFIKNKYPNIKFILNGTDESVWFYLKNDFNLIDKSVNDYKILKKFEIYDERKLDYILEK
jgi:hypothetical protein